MGGASNLKKTVITYTDFKPHYLPFMVNDLAAARRFLEQKNDAGEVNIHSLIIIGAEEGADLGFLFTAAEYARVYTIGVTALQSNGTPYNAGADIAAGIWLSLTARPILPNGAAPGFSLNTWARFAPGSRVGLATERPCAFIYGQKETHAKADSGSRLPSIDLSDNRPSRTSTSSTFSTPSRAPICPVQRLQARMPWGSSLTWTPTARKSSPNAGRSRGRRCSPEQTSLQIVAGDAVRLPNADRLLISIVFPSDS